MTSSSPSDFFTEASIGGPDLSQASSSLLVPFTARRLKAARVVWLNSEYLEDRGLEISNPETRRHIERHLLDQYAFCVPDRASAAHLVDDDSAIFYADRYGKSDGSYYGGSGRCGTRGSLNVKGIGVTPLVGNRYTEDPIHRTGTIYVEECAKEAIFSEVVRKDFPHSGVPVIAIIDMGFKQWFDRGHGGRRCLLLRPNRMRLAHLERSIFFGSAGTPQADQYLDSLRVRDVNAAIWGSQHRRGELEVECSSLREVFNRVARQLAYAQVHRISIGAMSSSNITLNGELLDFQSYTWVHNWSKVHELSFLPAFGDEWDQLKLLIRSTAFFQAKHLGRSESLGELQAGTRATMQKAFDAYVAAALGLRDPRNIGYELGILRLLRAYFAKQQQRPDLLDQKHFSDWSLSPDSNDSDGCPGVHALVKSLLNDASVEGRPSRLEREAVLENLERLAHGRPALHKQNLISTFRKEVGRVQDSEHYETALGSHIQRMVAAGRTDSAGVA